MILRNIGKITQARLDAIGVSTIEELCEVGVVDAYIKLKLHYPDQVSLNALWALYGAFHDMDWRDIPENIKAELRREVD